jgi:hypothetical protein
MNAIAIAEVDNNLLVVCPYCSGIHALDKATTGRLIELPAVCDDTKKYIIGETLKPKSLISAMNLYNYETERKRKQYQKRKATTAPEATKA